MPKQCRRRCRSDGKADGPGPVMEGDEQPCRWYERGIVGAGGRAGEHHHLSYCRFCRLLVLFSPPLSVAFSSSLLSPSSVLSLSLPVSQDPMYNKSCIRKYQKIRVYVSVSRRKGTCVHMCIYVHVLCMCLHVRLRVALHEHG